MMLDACLLDRKRILWGTNWPHPNSVHGSTLHAGAGRWLRPEIGNEPISSSNTTLPVIAAMEDARKARKLGVGQPDFSDLVSLVKSGKAYVKISVTAGPRENYSYFTPLAQMLISANVDRSWRRRSAITHVLKATSMRAIRSRSGAFEWARSPRFFDCHAFKRNRQEECVQMPVKIARSAPRPSFGLPELLVAIHTSRQSCYKAGKSANIHASSGVIRGIPAKDKITLRNRARVLEAELGGLAGRLRVPAHERSSNENHDFILFSLFLGSEALGQQPGSNPKRLPNGTA